MATGTVTNVIKAGGTTLAGVKVFAALVPEGPSFAADHSEVVGKLIATSDVSGAWSAALERTDTMTPANTLWKITERISGAGIGQPDRTHHISVTDTGTHTIDLLTQPTPTAITQNPNAHINPAGGISVGSSSDQLAGLAGLWSSVTLNLPNGLSSSIYDRGGREVNAGDPRFGMVFDGAWITDGAMSSGSAVLSSALGALSGLTVGLAAHVPGAGVAGATLHTTIASISSAPASVTLAAANASGGNLTGLDVHFGTDNTTAEGLAIASAVLTGGRLTYPHGKTFVSNQQTLLTAGLHEYDLNHSTRLAYTQGQNFFLSDVDLSDLEIHGGFVRGFPDPLASGGTLVRFRGSKNGGTGATNADQHDIHIHDIDATGLGVGLAYLVGVNRARISHNNLTKCGALVNFCGCSDSFADDSNTVDGQNFITVFTAPIACNVQQSNTNPPHNQNIHITTNRIRNYPAGEAILIHDLAGGIISGNTGDQVASGLVIAVTLNQPEQVSNVKAFGNRLVGHSTVAAGANWRTGLVVGGMTLGTYPWTMTDVVVTDNDVVGFNQSRNSGQGGLYLLGGMSDCDCSGNRLRNNYGQNLIIADSAGPITRVSLCNTRAGAVQTGAGTENEQTYWAATSSDVDVNLSGSQFIGACTYAMALASGLDLSALPVENVRFRSHTHNWNTLAGGAKVPRFPDGAWTFAAIGVPTAVESHGIGVGDDGTVTVDAGSTDISGTLTFVTGASPQAGVRWCQVTGGTVLPANALKGVHVYGLDQATTVLGPFWAENFSGGTGGWQLRSTGTPAAGTTYKVGYRLQTAGLQN